MADWTSSMQQTFEYYKVDPNSWADIERIDNVISSNISRDYDTDTLESATIDATDILTECYIRVYLITIQNGVREKHPLGTFLVQTPSSDFDGKSTKVSMDAYSPLIELKEGLPPIGYSLLEGEPIMDRAYMIIREQVRAPVVKAISDETLVTDFVANTNDTWASFTKDLIANAKFQYYLDEMGRVLFAPMQEIIALRQVWEFNDDNSSILYPQVSITHDLFGIPNVVEVVWTKGSGYYMANAENNDPNSPTSIQRRGRRITHRVTDPNISGVPSNEQLAEYAKQTLRELSSIEYSITYTHGYCPVRVGDCVLLNYRRAGLINVKAKVIKQTINCSSGCSVDETAIFSKKLWEG